MSGRAGRRRLKESTTSEPKTSRWSRFVSLMDERERATSLALIRIALASVLLADWAHAGSLGLVETLWGPSAQGGFGDADTWETGPTAFALFSASTTTTWLVYVSAIISAIAFGLGVLTRVSGVVLLFASTQFAQILGQSDRGIDIAMRIVLILLICSGCGETLSIDARRKRGAWVSDTLIPAWPRYLIIVQLCWIYFGAGIHKTQAAWWPGGDWSALYIILQDPHFARFDFGWMASVYPLTQLGTASTIAFELLAPVFGLALWYRRTRERPGRMRALLNRVRFVEIWLGTAIGFHVALMFTLQLGIFPYGMLSFYPAFARPERFEESWTRLRTRFTKPGNSV